MPNFKEVGFKTGPSIIGYKRLFQVWSKMVAFQGLKTSISDWSWKRTDLAQKRGTNLET